MDYPGAQVTCKGKVTKKYVQDGEHTVECQIWRENPRGEKATPVQQLSLSLREGKI
jgi:hypothetical protein